MSEEPPAQSNRDRWDLIPTPIGRPHLPDPEPASGVNPDAQWASPEEGSYDWHLQRAKNAATFGWLTFATSAEQIRDQKLFAPHFQSWKTFCSVELHQSASHVNRIIKGATLAIELQQAGCAPLPSCERQVRPLGVLRAPIDRITAWRNACAQKAKAFPPTAADVRRAVRRLISTPPNADPESLRRLKKELTQSRRHLVAATEIYSDPTVSEALQSAACLRDRRLIAKLIERHRELLSRFHVETKILL